MCGKFSKRERSNFVFSKSRKPRESFSRVACRHNRHKEGRKEGSDREGWREGGPINNTPRRGATVATPITPIVTHVSLYTRTRIHTRGLRLAFETSSSKKITHRSFSFFLFLFSFSGNCPRHAGVEEEKKLEVEERMNLLTILRSMRISSQFLGNPLSTCWRANANNTRIHDFGHFSRGILRVAIFRCTFEEKLTVELHSKDDSRGYQCPLCR